jgi:hypothetical protein
LPLENCEETNNIIDSKVAPSNLKLKGIDHTKGEKEEIEEGGTLMKDP